MKISILVFDLSNNSMVRTYPIAKVLERNYDIEVIGPVFGGGVYEPYRDEFQYKTTIFKKDGNCISRLSSIKGGINQLIDQIDGDVVYAFKPRFTSFGIALISGLFRKIPLVLDMEDWDTDEYFRASFFDKIKSLRSINDPNYNMLWNRALDMMIRRTDGITVVSDFLQNRYGGTKLPHGVDCVSFDPAGYNREALRKQWKVEDKFTILFTGMPRLHKGLDDLVQAMELLSDARVCLMFVGPQTEYLDAIKKRSKINIIDTGVQPHLKMPEFLSLADVVVLPQKNTAVAQAQVPGKVFEAMAMAKPIIATNVSDLPQILEGCGLVVSPSDPVGLSEAIKRMLNDSTFSNECGQKAREKCIKQYSWDAMEKILTDVFAKFT